MRVCPRTVTVVEWARARAAMTRAFIPTPDKIASAPLTHAPKVMKSRLRVAEMGPQGRDAEVLPGSTPTGVKYTAMVPNQQGGWREISRALLSGPSSRTRRKLRRAHNQSIDDPRNYARVCAECSGSPGDAVRGLPVDMFRPVVRGPISGAACRYFSAATREGPRGAISAPGAAHTGLGPPS